MSVELIICAHCGAENLPDRAVCQACGAELEALVEYPPAPRSKVRSEVLFALLAFAVGIVVGVLTYVNTAFLRFFGSGESRLFFAFFAFFFVGPFLAIYSWVVTVALMYSWHFRARKASGLSDKGFPVTAVIYAIALGIVAYLILNPFGYLLLVGRDILKEVSYEAPKALDSLLCVINPFLAFIVAVVVFFWLKTRYRA